MRPKVSVVVLVYNNIFGMEKTIQSILSQTYDNIQIKISDDGSKKFNQQDLFLYGEKLEAKYNDVEIIINEENVGTVKHLNNALKHTDGKYIIPCSSGDALFDEKTVEDIVAFMEKKKASIITGMHLDEYFEDGIIVRRKSRPEKFWGILLTMAPGIVRSYIRNKKNLFSGCSSCYSQKLFEDNGYFDEQYKLVEDYPYFLKLMKNRQKIYWYGKNISIHEMGGVSNGKVHPLVLQDLERIKDNIRIGQL